MTTREDRMPLPCELGWHRPRPDARWNNGYYFTRCARCGRDLVRTAYGRWHQPRGYRVVWQAQAPANAVSASLVPEEGRASAGARELPIQEVLRHLQNGEAERGPPPVGTAEALPDASPEDRDDSPRAPRPKSLIPDFMDEAGARPTSAYLQGRPRLDWEREWSAPEREPVPSRFSRVQTGFAGLFDRARRAGDEPRPGPTKRSRPSSAGVLERLRERAPTSESGLDRQSGASASRLRDLSPAFLIAIPIALLFAVLLALPIWIPTGDEAPASNGISAVPLSPARAQRAFVTASVLNCRSAPAMEAEPVTVLIRGDPVNLLARDGEWVSLVDSGGQCWALARYFSVQQPL